MTKLYISNTIELLYVSLMRRWQNTAPPDRHYGVLDGTDSCNSQSERLVFVLKKIAAGQEVRVFSCLETHCRRMDGESYVSKQTAWMASPVLLSDGWHLEGCQSLPQKLDVVRNLRFLGHSSRFVDCVMTFVANEDVGRFVPTLEQQEEILRELVIAGEIEHEPIKAGCSV